MAKLLCPECKGLGVSSDSNNKGQPCPTCKQEGFIEGEPDRTCKHLNGELFALSYHAKEMMYCIENGKLKRVFKIIKMNPTMRLLPKIMFRCQDCGRELEYWQYRDDHPKWLRQRIAVCVEAVGIHNFNDASE